MKTRILFYSLLLMLAGVASSLRADDAPDVLPTPAPMTAPSPAPKKEQKTELEKCMSQISKAAKKLRRQIQDPAQNADSLQLVATIHEQAEKSLTLTPAKAADLPEADRPKFVADYQAGMKEFIASVDKLSAALTANDNAKAAELLPLLFKLEKKDHKQFRRPDDK